jgi:hypothetical protein
MSVGLYDVVNVVETRISADLVEYGYVDTACSGINGAYVAGDVACGYNISISFDDSGDDDVVVCDSGVKVRSQGHVAFICSYCASILSNSHLHLWVSLLALHLLHTPPPKPQSPHQRAPRYSPYPRS